MTGKAKTPKKAAAPVAAPAVATAEQVLAFLKATPQFLLEHPDIIAGMQPPERELGEGIIDFQNYMVKHLQKDGKALEDRYAGLVEFCRHNMSIQAQVHNAALKLIRARTLEQLLEVLTLDLVSLFDVDVVRIAMESDTTKTYDGDYGEQASSGIVFVEPYTVDAALGRDKDVALIADCDAIQPAGFEHIFADCTSLIKSCALLRLELELVEKNVILAFGVRYKERFHAGQGIELLQFLAQIVGHQLDVYLDELAL